MLGGPSLPFRVRGEGRSPRPKKPRRGADVGFLGRGSQPPPNQLGSLGGALAAKRFSCILEASDGLFWNLLGAKFGRPWPSCPP